MSFTVKAALTVERRAPRTEADEFGAFARRILRAYSRRIADRDIEGLTGLARLREDVDTATTVAARALHDQGYSWTEIGRALGISRQAAQQRFSTKGEDE